MALSKVPLIVLFCILSCIDSSAFGESVQGFAEEVNADVKFECPYSEKVVYTVSNQIQCHHKCLRMERCAILNFKQHGGGAINDNCEVYGKTDKETTCRSVKDMNGWTAIILERVNNTVTQQDEPTFADCSDAFNSTVGAQNGIYKLYSGKHYCFMEALPGCGGGGWTIAAQMNGSLTTFQYSSPLWASSESYNVEKGLESVTSEEAKYPAFYNVSLKSVCLGMTLPGNETRWLRIDASNHTSLSNKTYLNNIFETGDPYLIAKSRAAWKNLVPGSSLQLSCNREGFNVRGDGNELKLRLGIVANQEGNCLTPESFIGFGSNMVSLCNPEVQPISSGNFAACFSDNGKRSVPVFGYILIK